MGDFVMSVLVKVKKILSTKMLQPTIYTIIMAIGIASSHFITKLRFTSYISITLCILVSISFFIGYRYPKKSEKRVLFSLIASILILLDGTVWMMTYKVEINLSDIGSIYFDFTPLALGFLLLLVFNIFLKSLDFIHTRRNFNEK